MNVGKIISGTDFLSVNELRFVKSSLELTLGRGGRQFSRAGMTTGGMRSGKFTKN